MVLPNLSRGWLPLQALARCDYIRTPVKFQGSDIFVFVGNSPSFMSEARSYDIVRPDKDEKREFFLN